jgi:hypothetical protein
MGAPRRELTEHREPRAVERVWNACGMTEASQESDRLPRGNDHQSIDHWAQHGVEELTEREAAERAELGDPHAEDDLPIPDGG